MLLGDEVAQFWSRVVIDCACDCWVWVGAIDKDGYGKFHVDGQWRRAHRVAYETWRRELGVLDVDHLCRVRRCVNPAHMDAVTRGVNVLRGEGVAANLARRSHCKSGHLLGGDNLAVETGPRGRPQRRCIRCRNDGQNRRRLVRKVADA